MRANVRSPGAVVAWPGAPGLQARLSKGARLLRWVAGSKQERGKVGWFVALLGAICFEGLGRKYLPFVPAILFYFLKDLVLVGGLAWFGIKGPARAAASGLYGPFLPVLGLAVVWTLIEMFNPDVKSLSLAITGFRSYWLWWLAPAVIANALRSDEDRRRGAVVLAGVALFIAGYAWLQFNSPASASINALTLYEGEVRADVAMVGSTGRVRVASTFAYLSGFADFAVMCPTLLLALGVGERERITRFLCVGAAVVLLATAGMTGSRMGVGLSALGLGVVVLTSGFAKTRAGRWAVGLALVAALGVVSVGQEALQGVWDRWQGDDTSKRLSDVWLILPPVALTEVEYPLLGIGTGMQQNARFQLGGESEWDSEEEPGRYLVELGVPGYLLVWFARLGLLFALVRVANVLRRAGRSGPASGALAYAALTMFGRLTFDHVWQALYFIGLGFLLSHYVSVTHVGRKVPAPTARTRTG